MTLDFPKIVDYLWAATCLLQLVLCTLLFIRGYFRVLPFFTAYIGLNLCQAVFLYSMYHHYGERSMPAYVGGWVSEAITLAARVFATVELLRLVLLWYRGIWGLTWRLLACVCPLVLLLISTLSRSDASVFVMQVDTGFHVVFAVALVLGLGLIHYYPIRVEPVYKVLLSGFCWYSCARILTNTVLHGYSYAEYIHYWPMWQTLAISSYLLVLILWGSALSHPAPATQQQPTLLTEAEYSDISPEINDHLEDINRRLINFWKIQGPKQ
ncbi:MAG TPA: hypothetical protein VH140_15790 [Candidatus Acidoferrum sp.]|nr:hypothetical protein [Candidatus Acidoferrum sp.]